MYTEMVTDETRKVKCTLQAYFYEEKNTLKKRWKGMYQNVNSRYLSTLGQISLQSETTSASQGLTAENTHPHSHSVSFVDSAFLDPEGRKSPNLRCPGLVAEGMEDRSATHRT